MHEARDLFQSLKTNSTVTRPCLSIPVGFPVEAFMRPVSTVAGKLNDNDIRGAKNILLNISSGTKEVTLDEVTDIQDYIQTVAGTFSRS